MATTFAICNVFSRVITIFAPYVAELKPETKSQWTFCGIALAALVSTLILIDPGTNKKNTKKTEDDNENEDELAD